MPNFLTLMTGICEMYGKNATETFLEVYWQSLSQFSFEEVSRALQAHVQNPDNGQFMPKPADVVKYIQGDTQGRALQAWSKVAEAIKNYGGSYSLVFDDPAIHAVIDDMGGWISLASCLEEEMPFRCNEFVKRYRSIVLKKIDSYPKKLVGRDEQHNQANGYIEWVQPPVFVGDAEKGMLVYENGNKKTLQFAHSLESISDLSTKSFFKSLENNSDFVH